MRWPTVVPRLRAALPAACLACALASCATGDRSLPQADQAFALSASALSGSDSYGLSGEVSVIDPRGVIARQARYTGQVTGHSKLKLQWSGSNALSAQSAKEVPAFQPLELLEAIQSRGAKAAYEGGTTADSLVRLRVTMAPEDSRRQIADGLRREMARLQADVKGAKLSAADRGKAVRILDDADRDLQAALSTLQASTVCLWTADRKTWFPRQMSEQTELAYTWRGKSYREKRVSVTNFLPPGRSGTMG